MADKKRVSPLMILPPLIFGGLAVLFYVGMAQEDKDALPSTRVGQEAPALTVSPLADYPTFDAASLKADGVKLVNFWASWCAPCRAEHGQLETMAEAGITIYGVNYKDKTAQATGFLDELGNPYAAIMADDTGRTGLEWGVYGVPETFVINGAGEVTYRFAGPITVDIMEKRILPAIEAAR